MRCKILLNYFSTYQYQILKLNNKKMRFLQHFSECILRMKIHKFIKLQENRRKKYSAEPLHKYYMNL